MPLYTFLCQKCNKKIQLLLSQAAACLPCPSCKADMKRTVAVGTVQKVEVIDNGLMYKAIERIDSIKEFMEEHKTTDTRLKQNDELVFSKKDT